MATRSLFATLIGINDYKNVPVLNGCVNDILNIDRILRDLCADAQQDLEYQPKYFLAPESGDTAVDKYNATTGQSIQYDAPTFLKITTEGFNHLKQAKDNDVCLLYYSGHGSYISAPPGWTGRNTTQCETLVCMDSRTDSRDLIDTEIAFLLHTALQNKPNVHCVVIMDCCHSSDNTRSIQRAIRNNTVTFRKAPPSNRRVTPQDYLGYREDFFNADTGQLKRDTARYVQLSACRNHEKSRDTIRGGLFSIKLHDLLRNGGTQLSYNQITDSLATTVSLFEGAQNPTCFAKVEADLDLAFLHSKATTHQPAYQVRYVSQGDNTGQWKLMAGTLQGIVPTADDGKTTVLINATPAVVAEVIEADDFSSLLSGPSLDALTTNTPYTATLTRLGIKKIRLAVDSEMPLAMQDRLHASFDPAKHMYIELTAANEPDADYCIQVETREKDQLYYLSQLANDLPLFDPVKDPVQFLIRAEAAGKWTHLRKLENPHSVFSADDFEFTIEIIQGQDVFVSPDEQKNLHGDTYPITPKEPQTLSYDKGIGPAFRLSVKTRDPAKHPKCHMEALYLDSLFGVERLSDPELNQLSRGGTWHAGIRDNNGNYLALIPLRVEDAYASYNIHSIKEYIKIFVSQKPDLDLEKYVQKSLTLTKRSMAKIRRTKPAAPSAWAIFTIELNITKSPASVPLDAAAEKRFADFSITAPAGIQAIATEIKAVNTTARRSARAGIGAGITTADAQPAIWGETLVADLPFGDPLGTSTGNGVVGIELHPLDRQHLPALQPGEEIVITPNALSPRSRSLHKEEETIIPYGFDTASGLYYPLGYEDATGKIHIQHLPAPTPGSFAPKAIATRSLVGSIKLYFKKIIGRKTHDLALHYIENGEWQRTTDAAAIKARLKNHRQNQNLPLVIHGIFGDTRSIVESLKTDETLAVKFPMILSFDYENLSTTIEKSAVKLKDALDAIGAFTPGHPKFTIIAHSMGGLVSRWLIEKEGGDAIVDKLVMAGTPNGGSEWGKAGQQIIDGLNLLLTHALNVTGPLQWVISGVGLFIKKLHDPKATLKAMDLNSEFIKSLADSALPEHVPYYMVGSNTGLLDGQYDGDDPFFKKLGVLFKTRLLYPGLDKALFKNQPNDMAVTLKSMQTMYEFADDVDTAMKILPGDHISYFSEPDTRKAILDFVSNGSG